MKVVHQQTNKKCRCVCMRLWAKSCWALGVHSLQQIQTLNRLGKGLLKLKGVFHYQNSLLFQRISSLLLRLWWVNCLLKFSHDETTGSARPGSVRSVKKGKFKTRWEQEWNMKHPHCNNNKFRLRFIAGFVPNVFGSFFSRDVQDRKWF